MFQKYCVVFQELFVVFADMGHRRTLSPNALAIGVPAGLQFNMFQPVSATDSTLGEASASERHMT